jgi:hypothetical protein
MYSCYTATLACSLDTSCRPPDFEECDACFSRVRLSTSILMCKYHEKFDIHNFVRNQVIAAEQVDIEV